MNLLARAYRGAVRSLGYAAGFGLAALALAITTDVVIRNLGLGNFPWLLEVSEYLLFASTFLAAPWVLRENAHVSVDLLLTGLAPGARRGLDALANLLGLAVSAVLAWYALRVSVEGYQRGDLIAKELVVPEWPLLALVALAGVLLCVEFVLRLARPLQADGAGA